MKNRNKIEWILVLAAISILLTSPLICQDIPEFLKGKIHILPAGAGQLEKVMETAGKEFLKQYKGESYLTGYVFQSRHSLHMGRRGEISLPYSIKAIGDEIKVRRIYEDRKSSGNYYSSEEGGEPIGLLFLHRMNGKKSEIVDTHTFDLDQKFMVDEIPLYWLGTIDNVESVNFIKKTFENVDHNLEKDLVYVIYSHDHPGIAEFLKKVSLGDYVNKTRESAIFWLGNIKEAKSLDYLKEIYRKSDETEIKKKVIFSIQLSDREEAVKELIFIAKNADQREVRKSAIFWLGQKASKESLKALKDVVEGSTEDNDVKKSAVFALSQLPHEEAVPVLIDIAKNNKSSEVRKNAIFWLGQTGDEKALKFFEDILLKK